MHWRCPAVNSRLMIRSPLMERLSVAPPPRDRWLLWLVFALILSLGVHFGFVEWARNHRVKTLSDAYYEEIVPRAFKVDRVEIDPRLLEEDDAEPAKEIHSIAPVPVELPAEDIGAEKPKPAGTPAKPVQLEIEKEPLPQAGSVDIKAPDRAMMQEDLNAMREALLSDTPASAAQPAIELAAAAESAEQSGGGGVPAGYSNLDDLLASSGGLTGAQGPIFMPSDVLFGYDESSLQSEAIDSLQKLGELVRRNPTVRFRIEGHTDSFGGVEYNARLSLARAESVKQWLTEKMSIAPDRIDTRGLGSSHPLAPLTGTIEEQKLNRRVEIVILGGGKAS